MDTDRDTAVLTELQQAKQWVKNEMKDDVWVTVTERQREIFKAMMLDWYGWPEFGLTFNKDLTKVMKCRL